MVLADENQIKAIISAVKELPVDCKNFDTADTWVGIVLELEKIMNNRFDMPETKADADKPSVPDPSEYIAEGE